MSSLSSTDKYNKFIDLLRKYNGYGRFNLNEIIAFLRNNPGFNVNKKNNNGQAPIISSVSDDIIINLLVNAGADINIRDNIGNTSLISKIRDWWNGTYIIVKALIKNGADVNIQNDEGETALKYAIENCYADALRIVKLLLNAGANVSLKDNRGKTALDFAYSRMDYYNNPETRVYWEIKQNMEQIVKLLEKEMMKYITEDIKTMNKRGMTVLKGLTEVRKDSKGNTIPLLDTNIIRRIMKQSKILMPPQKTPTSKKSDPTHKNKNAIKKQESV
jgi:hypothetical protein